MKKFTISAIALALALTGCSMSYSKPNSNSGYSSGSMSATNSNFNYKVGTASYTTTEETYGYSDGQNGNGSVKTAVVAAVFDNDGKIIKVSVDEISSNIYFDNMGALQNFTAGEVKSKKEMGSTYGMKAYSGIGKEWYEQAASIENWLVGKNVNEVIGGMSVSGMMRSTTKSLRNTAPYGTNSTNNNDMDKDYARDLWADEDLKASATIDTQYIRKALEKAYKNAK